MAVLGGGGSTWLLIAVCSRLYTRIKEAFFQSVENRIQVAIKAELVSITDKLTRLSTSLSDGVKRFDAIEKVESEIKESLLHEIRDITKDAVTWRNESHKEFVSKDAFEGKLHMAIDTHHKECKRNSHNLNNNVGPGDQQNACHHNKEVS
jgi:hypothetical protein